jgi:hypothetical protein
MVLKVRQWTIGVVWCFNLRMKVTRKPVGKIVVRSFRKAGEEAAPERVVSGLPWIARSSEATATAVARLAQVVADEQIKQLSDSRKMLSACREQVGALVGVEVSEARAGDVIRLCDFIHLQLQSIYDSAKSSKSRASHPKVSMLANAVASEARDLFDLVESVRWNALEAQADDDIVQGRTQVYDSVADMFKALNVAST